MTFQFQGNKYANEPEMRGDFTTNASVVDQISKRQDVCQVSFKNPTTPLAFVLRKLLQRDDVITFRRLFNIFLRQNCFRQRRA